MARILLVALNRLRQPYPAAPIGAAMISGALIRAGHTTHLLDLGTTLHPPTALRRIIRQFAPELIGFSMRNLDSCTMTAPTSYLPHARDIVSRVRALSRVPLMIGGAGFSLAPQQILAHLDIDWGVVGEGELAVPRLVDALLQGQDPARIPGVVGKSSAPCPREKPLRLDALPGQEHRQIDFKNYVRHGGFAGIQTRRGCNLTCSYCVYPYLEGRRMRLRSAEAVVEEIAAIHADGCRHFYFVDSAFNHPKQHALAICETLAARNLPLTWQAYVNPMGLDTELAAAMRASGCVGVELGLDAAEESMLVSLGKNFSLEDIAASSDALVGAGIPFAAHLLFGGPHETWQTIRSSAEFLDRYVRAHAVFPSLGIRVYPHTPIWEFCRDAGLVAADDPLLEPFYYCSPALGPCPMPGIDVLALYRPTWSTPTDWNTKSLSLIMHVLGFFQQRPLWKGVAGYGKRKPLLNRRLVRCAVRS